MKSYKEEYLSEWPRTLDELAEKVSSSLANMAEDLEFIESSKLARDQINYSLYQLREEIREHGISKRSMAQALIGTEPDVHQLPLLAGLLSRLQELMLVLHEKVIESHQESDVEALAYLCLAQNKIFHDIMENACDGVIIAGSMAPMIPVVTVVYLPPSFNGFKDEMQ